jgi:hypothetical protein
MKKTIDSFDLAPTEVGIREYQQAFRTNVWGGSTQTFTVPDDISGGKIRLSACAVGGSLAASATSQSMDGTANNVFFARLNGIDPPFIGYAKASSTYFSAQWFGKYCYGDIINSAVVGINGAGDLSNGAGRMNGNYFNALDVTPWGIVVSQTTGTSQRIGATTDGFNFTFTTITTSAAPVLYSCVFGGNGEAMIAIGTTANSNLYYTNDYGSTWKNLVGGVTTAVTRIRYLNGYWIAITGASTTFKYTNSPLTGNAVNAWSTSQTLVSGTADIGWTGTTGVVTYSEATNVQISSWAAGAAPSGSWATQAHGGNLAFDTCESGNGEVLLFKNATATTSATSVRATSGAATSYTSVNVFGATASEQLAYDSTKYIPFASGGMWVLMGAASAFVYPIATLASAIVRVATTVLSAGNTLTNATAINNIQYLGSNYVHLGSSNGLAKWSAASAVTCSLSTAAQLTAEFGYWDNVYRAPSFTIYKTGRPVLSLEGGGNANAGAIGSGTKGTGGGSPHYTTTSNNGIGPTGIGMGTPGNTNILVRSGNGGLAMSTTTAGGGTYNYTDPNFKPNANTLIPGGSGGQSGAGPIGGGGSLFSNASIVSANAPTFSIPSEVFSLSTGIGTPGRGANGLNYLTASVSGAAGGAEGCYEYEIPCVPGDVFTLEMPGAMYVFANGATGTNGGPGGESYAIIKWEA